jgi:hypothetical protein
MTHDESELLKNRVISEVSDDYEKFQMVLKRTKRQAASRGIKASETEVAKALERAISEGLISAYILSPFPPHSTKVEYRTDQLFVLWYYVTSGGKNAAKGIQERSGEY